MGTIQETEKAMADALIAALENSEQNGKWEMPWDANSGVPTNPTTGNAYSGGFNYFVLMMGGLQFGDNRWAGSSQWFRSPGKNHVKKGEKGTPIFFPRFNCAKCGTPIGRGNTCRNGHPIGKADQKSFAGWGSSFVFNNQQTVEPLPAPEIKDVDPVIGFEAAAAIVEKMGSELKHGGTRAFYDVKEDFIRVPEAGTFKTVADYWATVMHEHAHWTGAEKRLNRDGIVKFNGFGTPEYAYEELIAEIGAAFVCSHIGVKREGLFKNHVAYIASWKKGLKKDPGALRRATNEAGAVMRYLLK